MKWVVEKLSEQDEVTFRPKGHSMEPLVKHNQLVTVRKHDGAFIHPGTVVLAKVKGRVYLHKVVGVRTLGRDDLGDNAWSYQIGNNRGRVNGWASQVYAVMVNE